ncbi:hypothetical protein [Pararhodobacter sp. CCB-MM2]|uniref:hypothetical protein n=1 Tax=Pararhodobacter sp. CCB-MM2 TaxID=1786003 RepID=UPI00082FBBF2|nr:hypothetical protein [Pararhodobacter sp. CCB-MM2]
MRWLVFSLLMLTACGRALTPSETALASRMFGPSLDPAPVRFVENGFIGMRSHLYTVRPRTTCRERLLPPAEGTVERGRAAGLVLGHSIQVRPDVLRPDFARAEDGSLSLGQAMYLVHELTHVWQWQNRDRTGYSLWRVGREHAQTDDPYLFDTDSERQFLDYGYEQQASLVEEYLCCQALDPDGARTGRLRALLGQVMAPGDLPEVAISVPWAGVEPRGICG